MIRRINNISSHLENWRSAQREMVSMVAQEERRWFQSRGKGAWPRLNPDYAARKAAEGFGNKMLIREGDLYKSLTTIAALTLERAGNIITLGSDDPKAIWHAKGSGNLPVRNPLIPVPTVRQIARDTMQLHVRKALGGTA